MTDTKTESITTDYVFILNSNATEYPGYSDYKTLATNLNYNGYNIDEVTIENKITVYYYWPSPSPGIRNYTWYLSQTFKEYFPKKPTIELSAYAYKTTVSGHNSATIVFGYQIRNIPDGATMPKDFSSMWIRCHTLSIPETNGQGVPIDDIMNISVHSRITNVRVVHEYEQITPSKIGYTVIGY